MSLYQHLATQIILVAVCIFSYWAYRESLKERKKSKE